MRMHSALALAGLLTLASNFYKVQSVEVDATSCLQQNWIQCGISLGTAVFKLHSWSSDIPYKVKEPLSASISLYQPLSAYFSQKIWPNGSFRLKSVKKRLCSI